jgi:UPF0716 protein FxsA
MLILVLLFVVAPIVELAVIIQVAHGIGVANTIFLLIAVSVLGSWLVKREGLNTWRRIQASLERHELPTKDVVDGGLILFAGALLIAPGFISDVVGILLLLPPTRLVFRKVVLGFLEKRARQGRRIITVVNNVRRPADDWSPRGVIDTTGNDDR